MNYKIWITILLVTGGILFAIPQVRADILTGISIFFEPDPIIVESIADTNCKDIIIESNSENRFYIYGTDKLNDRIVKSNSEVEECTQKNTAEDCLRMFCQEAQDRRVLPPTIEVKPILSNPMQEYLILEDNVKTVQTAQTVGTIDTTPVTEQPIGEVIG